MILSTLNHSTRYLTLTPRIRVALEYIATAVADHPDGIVEVAEGVRAIYSRYQTRVEEAGAFESHRKVIDVQLPLHGFELVEWAPRDAMSPAGEYDEVKDVQFFVDPTHACPTIIGGGVFAIFYPEDAHRPGLSVGGACETIKKLTLKVLV